MLTAREPVRGRKTGGPWRGKGRRAVLGPVLGKNGVRALPDGIATASVPCCLSGWSPMGVPGTGVAAFQAARSGRVGGVGTAAGPVTG